MELKHGDYLHPEWDYLVIEEDSYDSNVELDWDFAQNGVAHKCMKFDALSNEIACNLLDKDGNMNNQIVMKKVGNNENLWLVLLDSQ